MRHAVSTLCVFLTILIANPNKVFSQKKEATAGLKGKSTVFVELFGNGFGYSLNYDRVFFHEKKNALTWRVGLAYLPSSRKLTKAGDLSLLGEFNYLRGKRSNFLELGLGITYWKSFELSQDKYIPLYLVTRIGYRYQKENGGFFMRIGVLPIIDLSRYPGNRLSLFGGLSLGFTLKNSGKKNKSKNDIYCP